MNKLINKFSIFLCLKLVNGFILELRIKVSQILISRLNYFEDVKEYEKVEACSYNTLVGLDKVAKLTKFSLLTHILLSEQGVISIMLAFLQKN
jgi:hypothetical protein